MLHLVNEVINFSATQGVYFRYYKDLHPYNANYPPSNAIKVVYIFIYITAKVSYQCIIDCTYKYKLTIISYLSQKYPTH